MTWIKFEPGEHFSRMGRLRTKEARSAYYDLLAMALSEENGDGSIQDTLEGFAAVCRLTTDEMKSALDDLDGRFLSISCDADVTDCYEKRHVTSRDVTRHNDKNWIILTIFDAAGVTRVTAKNKRILSGAERNRKYRSKLSGSGFYVDDDGNRRDVLTDDIVTKCDAVTSRSSRDAIDKIDKIDRYKIKETHSVTENVTKSVTERPQSKTNPLADEDYCRMLLKDPRFLELGGHWITFSTEECRRHSADLNEPFTRRKLISWLANEVTSQRSGKKPPPVPEVPAHGSGNVSDLSDSDREAIIAKQFGDIPDPRKNKNSGAGGVREEVAHG